MSAATRISVELRTLPAHLRSDVEPGPSIPATPAESERSSSPSSSDVDIEDAMGASTGEAHAALPPVDRGLHAWRFLAAATFMETTVWGLPFTVGVLHQYWSTHLFVEAESTLTLAATLQTGLMYMSTAGLGP